MYIQTMDNYGQSSAFMLPKLDSFGISSSDPYESQVTSLTVHLMPWDSMDFGRKNYESRVFSRVYCAHLRLWISIPPVASRNSSCFTVHTSWTKISCSTSRNSMYSAVSWRLHKIRIPSCMGSLWERGVPLLAGSLKKNEQLQYHPPGAVQPSFWGGVFCNSLHQPGRSLGVVFRNRNALEIIIRLHTFLAHSWLNIVTHDWVCIDIFICFCLIYIHTYMYIYTHEVSRISFRLWLRSGSQLEPEDSSYYLYCLCSTSNGQ